MYYFISLTILQLLTHDKTYNYVIDIRYCVT
jgi:hypothetical protein